MNGKSEFEEFLRSSLEECADQYRLPLPLLQLYLDKQLDDEDTEKVRTFLETNEQARDDLAFLIDRQLPDDAEGAKRFLAQHCGFLPRIESPIGHLNSLESLVEVEARRLYRWHGPERPGPIAIMLGPDRLSIELTKEMIYSLPSKVSVRFLNSGTDYPRKPWRSPLGAFTVTLIPGHKKGRTIVKKPMLEIQISEGG